MKRKSKTTEFNQLFGRIVRERREQLKISQEDLADEAPVHRTYVSSIELGKTDLSLSVAYKVSKALKIPLYKLVEKTESSLK